MLAVTVIVGGSLLYADAVYVSPTGSGTEPYDTWAKATPSLATALSFASADDGVLVADGTYTAPPEGFFAGNDIDLESLNGAEYTVIEGGGGRCLRVSNAFVSGFTIRNGVKNDGYGGGVWIAGHGYVMDCIIEDCTALRGGGVYITNAMINDCRIERNVADMRGGGIYAHDSYITDSIIRHNDVENGLGGGAYLYDSHMHGCLVEANTNSGAALGGGGVASYGESGIIDCHFIENVAYGWFGGGGVLAEDHSTISRCLVWGNRSLYEGLFIEDGAGGGLNIATNVIVESCRIMGNGVDPENCGAGVFCYKGGILRSCLVAENFATNGLGAGVYLYRGGRLQNCTITMNSANNGAGVFFDEHGAVENSIVYGNELDKNYAGDAVHFSRSCVTPDAGGDNIDEAPGFRDYFRGNYRLNHGNSPCKNTAWPADWMDGSADAYGNPRIINGMPDIGACESGTTTMDYDADDITDRTVFGPSIGRWFGALTGGGVMDMDLGWAAAIPLTGDFDADGTCDPTLYHPESGDWYIQTTLEGLIMTNWGWSAAVPVPGDYDGDGRHDIAVYDPVGYYWYVLSATGTAWQMHFGWSGAIPVPGDYDGDAITDEAHYTPSTGRWVVMCTGSSPLTDYWGWEDAVPVPADYDGDGQDNIAVYDPSTGDWYIRGWGGSLNGRVNWGWENAVPIPADYDGDGTDDITVYDPSTGDWYIRFSSGGCTIVEWGWSQAFPPLTQFQINRWYEPAL